MINNRKLRVLHITPEPPENFCGVRLVMYRHLIERSPFELMVVTNRDYLSNPESHEEVRLPYLLYRLRRSRFGPLVNKWLADFENLIWPHMPTSQFDEIIKRFNPDIILALAHNGISDISARLACKHRVPLVGLFLDWFPIMKGHIGHRWTSALLSRRFHRFYEQCDLAFCTSDGMKDALGAHPNCHVIYPMPAKHRVRQLISSKSRKFRLVYVGSVENFYGRMMCELIKVIENTHDLEIIIVGPNADWPTEILQHAIEKGIYLGFKPTEEASDILATADALLVVMSFEIEHRHFMETSFTTKFLDYTAYAKPIIIWGPEYCTPVKLVSDVGGAYVVSQPRATMVADALRQLMSVPSLHDSLTQQAKKLHEELFNPDHLQRVFVNEIEKLASAPNAL